MKLNQTFMKAGKVWRKNGIKMCIEFFNFSEISFHFRNGTFAFKDICNRYNSVLNSIKWSVWQSFFCELLGNRHLINNNLVKKLNICVYTSRIFSELFIISDDSSSTASTSHRVSVPYCMPRSLFMYSSRSMLLFSVFLL